MQTRLKFRKSIKTVHINKFMFINKTMYNVVKILDYRCLSQLQNIMVIPEIWYITHVILVFYKEWNYIASLSLSTKHYKVITFMTKIDIWSKIQVLQTPEHIYQSKYDTLKLELHSEVNFVEYAIFRLKIIGIYSDWYITHNYNNMEERHWIKKL